MAVVKSRIAVAILSVTILLFGVVSPSVFAQEASQTPEQIVTERCQLAQKYLKESQRSRDLRARVDRLQAYRYIYQRLDMFTKRLERNSQPQATELRATLNELNKQIETFKSTYEQYDQARDAVSNLPNCRSNIVGFQAKLTTAREKRQEVAVAVVKTEEVLNPRAKSQLDVLYQTLLSAGNSEGAL